MFNTRMLISVILYEAAFPLPRRAALLSNISRLFSGRVKLVHIGLQCMLAGIPRVPFYELVSQWYLFMREGHLFMSLTSILIWFSAEFQNAVFSSIKTNLSGLASLPLVIKFTNSALLNVNTLFAISAFFLNPEILFES